MLIHTKFLLSRLNGGDQKLFYKENKPRQNVLWRGLAVLKVGF